MTPSNKARICLWNAIEAAEQVGGKVIFDLTKGLAIIRIMDDEDASKFHFADCDNNQLHATRKP
jgi:hypothetical protein